MEKLFLIVLLLMTSLFAAGPNNKPQQKPVIAAPQSQAPQNTQGPATVTSNGSPVQKQFKSLNTTLWKTQKSLADLSARVDADKARLQDSLSRLAARVQRLNKVEDSIQTQLAQALSVDSISKISVQRMQSIEKTTRRFFAALTAVILALFVLVLLLMRRIRQAPPLPTMIHSEVQYFFNKLKGILNRQPGDFTPEIDDTRVITPDFKETDHTLPVRVAEEVFRMRARLSRMPADTKGLAALTNAVKRLEDDLNVKGYTVADLADQPYVDEMTLQVREFVPRDDLPPGTKKILRMVRPQVKFKNVIISQGEAEVAMSAEDLAQK